MDTVLIHLADGTDRDGRPRTTTVALGPGAKVRFGRGAPGVAVDVRLADPGVPRLAGEIQGAADHWLLSNFSADKTYVVENPEGAGEHVKVPPGRLAAPIPFEISRVVLPAGLDFVRFSVFAPMHAYLDRAAAGAPDGEGTLAAFPLDESAKYFLVLVALCEPRLRDRSHVAIPTVENVVNRLRPLPACADLTVAAVNFHIDYLARTKLRVKQDAVDGARRLDTKRAALVSLALRFNLVREDHLRLLPTPVGAG
ncbi:serine/threonine protein kinase [Actinoplanes teichomyceticus]|uniref:FHA domain-containing protein n=1 Tax=Actinoplanes teichomyceticus TaxID=1867 RepID=A0A561WBF7_ACTTI|nr:serine/threonine protein kinase [Actinoplanes teichomyceticus]TWG21189.1 hypothetical protein FHX34_103719 [Actinoplanes teichomyceticus]GIF15010.1 hypothetical protein Ate01nite_50420 [Actinoplanes teichomyceticus]